MGNNLDKIRLTGCVGFNRMGTVTGFTGGSSATLTDGDGDNPSANAIPVCIFALTSAAMSGTKVITNASVTFSGGRVKIADTSTAGKRVVVMWWDQNPA